MRVSGEAQEEDGEKYCVGKWSRSRDGRMKELDS